MKIGVEEEFIVVDPKTLFLHSGSFRLATHLIYKNPIYQKKCSVEMPLNSGSVKTILQNAGKAFCVFEVKTDPYEDIDRIREELKFHRGNVADIARDNHLMVLPTGLHPAHSSKDFVDHCAAFHVHLDYSKEAFQRLYGFIPFLISQSTNSPFLDGKIQAMSNRMHLSAHVNIPTMGLQRNADIIHNPSLNTVEVKVFDTQITIDESMGLASLVKMIGEDPCFHSEIMKGDYVKLREQAILYGSKGSLIDKDHLRIFEDNVDTSKILNQMNGSDWQIELFKKHGLSSVVHSLWESFQHDERMIKTSSQEIDRTESSFWKLFYQFPYSPFLCMDKYNKYLQDIAYSGGLRKIIHH